MTKTEVSGLRPFEFQSDFSPPAPPPAPADDRILISVAELAGLLDDTRNNTAKLVRDRYVQQQTEAMKQSSASLRTALIKVVELADALEKATLSSEVRAEAKSKIRQIAAELVDGQGNLFQT
ncbi:hypothetical protein [Henriciella litoralis]|uniref:hypothetical protein n=1 Tax=Henriciella litoralis TaxID=568102 RepID=UPI000A03FA36|nr:hypothetical protein [Henriciella litoralis]